MPKIRKQSAKTRRHYRRQYEQRRNEQFEIENIDKACNVVLDGYPFSISSTEIEAGLTLNVVNLSWKCVQIAIDHFLD